MKDPTAFLSFSKSWPDFQPQHGRQERPAQKSETDECNIENVDYLCHHTAGANRTTVPNRHAGQHDNIATQPTVVADVDRLTKFRTLGALPNRRIQWVRAGIEAAIGAYERPRTDADRARVNEGGIEVQLCTFTENDIEAVICLNWGADPRLFGEDLVICFRSVLARWQGPCVVGNTVYVPMVRIM